MDDLDLATIADERNEDAAEDARDRARLERKPPRAEPTSLELFPGHDGITRIYVARAP